MKTIAAVVGMALCCLAFSCARPVDLQQAEQGVRNSLDQYVESVELEDMDLYASNFCHDAHMMNFGAFGPPIIGWEGLQKVMEGQNAGLDSIKVDQSEVQIHVFPSGRQAWATSLWTFQAKSGANVLNLPVRCTWVLEKLDGKWEIVHFHKSIAAG